MQFAVLKRGLMLCAVAAVAVGSLSLIGCNQVSDSLTGVSLEHGKRAERCIKECREVYKFQVFRELKKHLEERMKCQRKSGNERTACLSAEQARHEAAEKALEAAQRDCINRCHRQGGDRDHDKDDDRD